MNKNQSVVILGFLIALMPFLGLPLRFKELLLIIFGLALAYIGFKLSRNRIQVQNKRTDIFMDGEREENKKTEAEIRTKNLLNVEKTSR